jgi:hypothetical protein
VRRAVFVCVLVAGCAGPQALERAWDTPGETFLGAWDAQARLTSTVAFLAEAEFAADGQHEAFTLEIFFAAPDEYLLRGRGALGATGFRARIHEDSLVLLLNRERRGFAGRIADYPDSTLRELWQLLHVGLPWLTGQVDLRDSAAGLWRVDLAERGSRPAAMAVDLGARHLDLEFGRFRNGYPYWQLTAVQGTAPDGWLSLAMRQRLYNPPLDTGLFRLQLPKDTRPLTD